MKIIVNAGIATGIFILSTPFGTALVHALLHVFNIGHGF